MKTKLQSFVIVLFAALVAIAASGCRHTAHGVGEDLEEAGEKIQEKTR